jgi:hypothetical protein
MLVHPIKFPSAITFFATKECCGCSARPAKVPVLHDGFFEACFSRLDVKEIVLRIVVGGVVVSAFALLGDVLKPKSFAGLFGAAPSVALATLVLTVMKEGKTYASLEARSMILGAVAFMVYACVVSRVLIRRQWPVLSTTSAALVLWFGCAFSLWYGLLR